MTTVPTLQELFDKTALHMLTQGEPAVENGECRYRYNGLMCAVGCLIKVEHYDTSLEGDGVTRAHVLQALLDSEVVTREDCYNTDSDMAEESMPPRIRLLNALQRCHDSNTVMADKWGEKLIEIAKNFNLNSDVVTNFKGETND